MKVGVVGSGGVGGYFGAKLASCGVPVQFYTTPRHAQAITSNGLLIKSYLGDFSVKVPASTDPASLADSELLLITVKSWQIQDVAKILDRHVSKSCVVVPLENGISAVPDLCECFGPTRVLGAVCKIVSFIEEPGIICHTGVVPWIALGELNGDLSPRALKIGEVLKSAGLQVDVRDDIHTAIWEKFIFITAWSTVGALTRRPIGELRSFAPTRDLLIGILEEIFAIGVASDIRLPKTTIKSILEFIDSRTPENTASMQRDMMAGRPSEFDAQTGAAVNLAKKLNIPTPNLNFAYACLALQEQTARMAP